MSDLDRAGWAFVTFLPSKHLCSHDDYCYSLCAICRLLGEFEQQSKYINEYKISTLRCYLQKSKSFILTPTALQISALQDSTCIMPQNLNDLDRELLRSRNERKVFSFRHSPYDCSQKDVDDYTKRHQARKVRYMQLWKANHEIAVFLNPSSTLSPEVLAALHRLKVARWTEPWSPDVIIKPSMTWTRLSFIGGCGGESLFPGQRQRL